MKGFVTVKLSIDLNAEDSEQAKEELESIIYNSGFGPFDLEDVYSTSV